MKITFATIGLVGIAGALSICPLCGVIAGQGGGDVSLVSAANAVQVVAPLSAQTPATVPAQVPSTQATSTVVTLKIKGMTCGGCVFGVKKVLTRLDGVSKADVSYEKASAVVTFNPAKVTVEQMIAAIKTLRYTAKVA